jgi:hypothetical protein
MTFRENLPFPFLLNEYSPSYTPSAYVRIVTVRESPKRSLAHHAVNMISEPASDLCQRAVSAPHPEQPAVASSSRSGVTPLHARVWYVRRASFSHVAENERSHVRAPGRRELPTAARTTAPPRGSYFSAAAVIVRDPAVVALAASTALKVIGSNLTQSDRRGLLAISLVSQPPSRPNCTPATTTLLLPHAVGRKFIASRSSSSSSSARCPYVFLFNMGGAFAPFRPYKADAAAAVRAAISPAGTRRA